MKMSDLHQPKSDYSMNLLDIYQGRRRAEEQSLEIRNGQCALLVPNGNDRLGDSLLQLCDLPLRNKLGGVVQTIQA